MLRWGVGQKKKLFKLIILSLFCSSPDLKRQRWSCRFFFNQRSAQKRSLSGSFHWSILIISKGDRVVVGFKRAAVLDLFLCAIGDYYSFDTKGVCGRLKKINPTSLQLSSASTDRLRNYPKRSLNATPKKNERHACLLGCLSFIQD